MAVFAVVRGSMAGPTAYTRLAEELRCRGHRALLVELPVDRPELTGPTTPARSPSNSTPPWPRTAPNASRWWS
jgi:hypothetical protein